MSTRVKATHPLSPDDVTDIIEAIVDALDRDTIEPSVTANGTGTDIHLYIEATLPRAHSRLDAHVDGVPALKAALNAADILTPGNPVLWETDDPKVLVDA